MKLISKNEFSKKKIKDIARINMGQSPSSKSYCNTNEGFPFFQGVAEFGEKYPAVVKHTNEPKKYAQKNDILISVRAPVGRINISKEKISIGRGLAAINSENNNIIYYLLKYHLKDWKKVSQGAIFDSINKEDLENFEIYFPNTIEEQKRIADLLDQQQSLIDSYKEKLSILEKQESYYQDELLSGRLRIRLTQELIDYVISQGWYQDNDIVEGKEEEFEKWISEGFEGKVEFYENKEWINKSLNRLKKSIPNDWVVYNINDGQINIIKSGVDEYKENKKYFATGGVGYFNELNSFKSVSYEDKPARANMTPIKNSIWFARMKDTEKYLYFKNGFEDIVLSTGFLGLECHNVCSEYVFHFIKSNKFVSYKNKLASGSTQEAITNKNSVLLQVLYPKNNIEAFLISILLNKYINVKNNINEKIKLEDKRMNYLMDELLSGRIRIEE